LFAVLKFGNSVLVGYDYISLGNTFALLQKNVAPTTARIERLKKKARYNRYTKTHMQNVEGLQLAGKANRPIGEVWVGLGWVALILKRHVIISVLKGHSPNGHQYRCWNVQQQTTWGRNERRRGGKNR